MKKHLFARYAVLVISLLLALSAPVETIRFIAYLLFLLIACSLLYDLLTPRMIRVRRLDPEIRGARQESVPVRLVVENRLPFPLSRIVMSESPRQLYCEQPTRELILPPSGGIELTMKMRGERRGEYLYGPLRLHGSDPFALFAWEHVDSAGARAVIYPRIFPISLEDRQGSVGGSIPTSNPAYEDVTRFRSLREYATGDDPKRVNWKASAKAGKLFTTEYERTLSVGVRVILNLSSDDYPPRRRDQFVERAVEVAAALVFSYTRLGQRIGLIAAAELPEGADGGRRAAQAAATPLIIYGESAGHHHSERLLEVLSRVEPRAGSADYLSMFYSSRGLPADLRFLLVAPKPNARQVDQLRTIRAGRLRVELFEVPTGESAADELAGVLAVRRVSESGEDILGR